MVLAASKGVGKRAPPENVVLMGLKRALFTAYQAWTLRRKITALCKRWTSSHLVGRRGGSSDSFPRVRACDTSEIHHNTVPGCDVWLIT